MSCFRTRLLRVEEAAVRATAPGEGGMSARRGVARGAGWRPAAPPGSARRVWDRWARRHTFLAEAAMVLGSSLDSDHIADLSASLAVPLLADGAMLFVRQVEGEIPLAAVVHRDPAAVAFLRALVELRPPCLTDNFGAGLVLRTGQTWYVPHLPPDLEASIFPTEFAKARYRRLRSGPSLAVPLPGPGRVLGALLLVREHGRFTAADTALAEVFGAHIGLALENARLFGAQRESAITLQRSLLPAHPPALVGAEVAMEYRPGTAGTQVGGDLYDVIPLADGRVGVAIGDVMGRGLGAAAQMGQLRAALRAYARDGRGPASLLRALAGLAPSLGVSFATCLYAVYDPARRHLVMSSAGHLPPLVCIPGAPARFLDLDAGLSIGVPEDLPTEPVAYAEMTLDLPPGSAVVLYTDGLVESRRLALTDGMDRLRAAFGSDHAVPARARHAAADVVTRALATVGGGPRAEDDIAVIVLVTRADLDPLLDVRLPAEARSAGVARDRLGAALAARGLADLASDAGLLVSEAVTNALLHARSDVRVRAGADGGRLRVSVEDREPGRMPKLSRPHPRDEHGWGLVLMAGIADRWGVETTTAGKRVWFELDHRR
jgi:serine phosphatase RsbU (regulator of sigma subunit)/anti-sigma regulatory factor (Ser/Thr protein kinase)